MQNFKIPGTREINFADAQLLGWLLSSLLLHILCYGTQKRRYIIRKISCVPVLSKEIRGLQPIPFWELDLKFLFHCIYLENEAEENWCEDHGVDLISDCHQLVYLGHGWWRHGFPDGPSCQLELE